MVARLAGLGLLLAMLASHAAHAAVVDEFDVELPTALRQLAGHGQLSPVAHARVAIVVPPDLARDAAAPVLVINATADPGYRSSRALMRRYADVASANGWIVVAADPAEDDPSIEDNVSLRFALDMAALAVLAQRWPGTGAAPLAFGGFSGGAKISGWLASAFAGQGRTVVGVYLAGINEDTLVPAATQLDVLDATFRRIPVFLQSGDKDDIATPVQHREVAARLKRAGFLNVRIRYSAGRHEVDPAPLEEALHWFRANQAK